MEEGRKEINLDWKEKVFVRAVAILGGLGKNLGR
jgi:hypothetical protein